VAVVEEVERVAAGRRVEPGAALGNRLEADLSSIDTRLDEPENARNRKEKVLRRIRVAAKRRSRRPTGKRSAPRRAARAAGADPGVPEATVSGAGGVVSVEIAFGHAQHAKYTIQLFDPRGKTELWRQSGLSTDDLPDCFDLERDPEELERHLLQWSGAVSAFTPAPGQQYSVIFEVSQDGIVVPGGRVERTGPLDVTQAFLGILRLVTR